MMLFSERMSTSLVSVEYKKHMKHFFSAQHYSIAATFFHISLFGFSVENKNEIVIESDKTLIQKMCGKTANKLYNSKTVKIVKNKQQLKVFTTIKPTFLAKTLIKC